MAHAFTACNKKLLYICLVNVYQQIKNICVVYLTNQHFNILYLPLMYILAVLLKKLLQWYWKCHQIWNVIKIVLT